MRASRLCTKSHDNISAESPTAKHILSGSQVNRSFHGVNLDRCYIKQLFAQNRINIMEFQTIMCLWNEIYTLTLFSLSSRGYFSTLKSWQKALEEDDRSSFMKRSRIKFIWVRSRIPNFSSYSWSLNSNGDGAPILSTCNVYSRSEFWLAFWKKDTLVLFWPQKHKTRRRKVTEKQTHLHATLPY